MVSEKAQRRRKVLATIFIPYRFSSETDISEAAIRLASEKALKEGLEITWEQDDILATRLDRQFDLIFDRGLFHVLAPERRGDYVRIVSGLLKTDGYLFLKCFSRLQSGEQGPYRFTPEQIQDIFGSRLSVLSIKETVYQGTLDPLPHALFCTMRKRSINAEIGSARCVGKPSDQLIVTAFS